MPEDATIRSHPLPEIDEIEALAARAGARLRTLARIECQGQSLPILALVMGSDDPRVPALGLFGGVHGVERIGVQVVLAYMHSLIEGLHWSSSLRAMLADLHLVFVPVVNPGGVLRRTRCNPNGVDLMRNAPVESADRVPFLIGGQRISRHLPWFRGASDQAMETEAQALCQVVEEHLLCRPFSIALDCHSGYGVQDRIWFPYAHTRSPISNLAEIKCLKDIFDRTYPNHRYYRFEPQALNYTAHGDLWDFLYDRALQRNDGVFLPLTLEMGSWAWVKKNPWQLLRLSGMFNPVLPHRHRRILRRHLVLIEFLLRAVQGYRGWLPADHERQSLTDAAQRCWYPHND